MTDKPQSLILDVRQALGLTQSELAQLLGTQALTISKWERGVSHPNSYQIAFLRAFYSSAQSDPMIGRKAILALTDMGVCAAIYTLLAPGMDPKYSL